MLCFKSVYKHISVNSVFCLVCYRLVIAEKIVTWIKQSVEVVRLVLFSSVVCLKIDFCAGRNDVSILFV